MHISGQFDVLILKEKDLIDTDIIMPNLDLNDR